MFLVPLPALSLKTMQQAPPVLGLLGLELGVALSGASYFCVHTGDGSSIDLASVLFWRIKSIFAMSGLSSWLLWKVSVTGEEGSFSWGALNWDWYECWCEGHGFWPASTSVSILLGNLKHGNAGADSQFLLDSEHSDKYFPMCRYHLLWCQHWLSVGTGNILLSGDSLHPHAESGVASPCGLNWYFEIVFTLFKE